MIGIYKFQNLITNEIYIGQSINLESRFKKHLREWPYGDTKFYKGIQQYGWENFSYEIIEECSQDELNEKEKYWIAYYDSYFNGYNSTPGGANKFTVDYDKIYLLYDQGKTPKEIADELQIGLSTVYSWLNSYSNWQPIVQNNTIFQYSLDGQYIQEWPSCKEVQRQLKINASTIGLVLVGKRKSAGGFQWSKEKKTQISSVVGQTSHSKEIHQYSLDGIYVQSFESIAEAARQVHGNSSAIRRAAKVGLSRSAYGYRWTY